ncbi:hypothetical protein IAR55_004163 [Kwoniella newhampshirensis]|uniref:G-protein coupled receptors family 1 profile domain-containing protein n=1 Tax=Kwoniella newhampshirensis TaxID=1651941 RepID=A0AAW0YLV6_9TREE
MTFGVSPDRILHINSQTTRATTLSLGLALFILFSSSWICRYPSARSKIDRISFRLLLWSMAFEVVYDVSYIVCNASPESVVRLAKTQGCVVGIYFLLGSMGVVNYLFTCTALNLMMTICFQSNPVALGLEKWYIGVSIVLGMGVPIVPAALGHFGQDTNLGACYFTSVDKDERFKLLLLDLYIWQGLSGLVACGAIVAILIKLSRHGQATTQALMGGNSLNRALQETIDVAQFVDYHNCLHVESGCGCRTVVPVESSRSRMGPVNGPSRESRWTSSFLLFRKSRSRRPSDMIQTNQAESSGVLQARLFGIALRISMYPVALIVVNGILTAGDLYLTHTGGVQSKASFVLYVIYDFLYGGRGIVFASVGILVDPCLFRGLKAASGARRRSQLKAKVPRVDASTPRYQYNGEMSAVGPKGANPAANPSCDCRSPARMSLALEDDDTKSTSSPDTSVGTMLQNNYSSCRTDRLISPTWSKTEFRRSSSFERLHIQTPRNGSSSSATSTVLVPYLGRPSIIEASLSFSKILTRGRSTLLVDCSTPEIDLGEPLSALTSNQAVDVSQMTGQHPRSIDHKIQSRTTCGRPTSSPSGLPSRPSSHQEVIRSEDRWQTCQHNIRPPATISRLVFRRASEGGMVDVPRAAVRPSLDRSGTSRERAGDETGEKLFNEIQAML